MDGLGFLQSLTADKGHVETTSKDDARLKAKHDAMNAIKNRELNIQSQFNSELWFEALHCSDFTWWRYKVCHITYDSDLQGLFNDVSIYWFWMNDFFEESVHRK